MKCFAEDGKPSDEMTSVEVRDDGLYRVTCSRGHVSVTAIQQQKFEILFDFAAMALIDGYTKEAVSTMASALERFYEYYVQVACIKKGISQEFFNQTWKPVARQSERQLGAFLFVYLLLNGKPLDRSVMEERPSESYELEKRLTWTEFRNNVIHKGYIPSEEEVYAYGDLIYQFIYRLIDELRASCSDAMQKATFCHLINKALASDVQVSTMAAPTLIRVTEGSTPAGTFREALSDLDKYRRWLYHRR